MMKLALAQHPMYLLIEEDTQCAERTPPWGAPDIDAYIERVRRNLAMLEQQPSLRLGYEWSALELERLARRAPEVFRRMVDSVKRGACAFYNGTYAQPHLQVLTSEANYRQFEIGARTYRELCGAQVLTYAHQEASVHEQVPQLLDAFGIRFAALPSFISTLVPLGEIELLHHSRFGLMFVEGDDLVWWRGLDGTKVPLYLHQKARGPIVEWIEFQEMLGLQHSPPLIFDMPDLIEVDDAWMDDRRKADFVLLDHAIRERIEKAPPRTQARLFTNWSYMEGIRAEELARCDRLAEEACLRAESLGAMAHILTERVPKSTEEAWKSILLTQHHDVYCFCAPELREKSVQWLRQAGEQALQMADEAARAIIGQMAAPRHEGIRVTVFNPFPHQLTSVVTVADPPGSAAFDETGRMVPSEMDADASGSARLSLVAELPGLGYRSFYLREAPRHAARREASASTRRAAEATSFENRFYCVVVASDGSLSRLSLAAGSGAELLDSTGAHANLLRATDSSAVERGPKTSDAREQAGQHERWRSPEPGPAIRFEPQGPPETRTSELGMIFRVNGRLGSKAGADLTLRFYKELPHIDVEWRFQFDGCSIGSFFDDESKLHVVFPLAFKPRITHDIPFGYVESRAGRPFFPASWVDLSDGRRGLAYFHMGTCKHWVHDNTLANLLAWGEHTDAIGNRLDNGYWAKSFDQRLRGSHSIRYAIYPHEGDFRAGGVVRAALAWNVRFPAYRSDSGAGQLPDRLELLSIEGKDITATSVSADGEGIACRIFSNGERDEPLRYRSSMLSLDALQSIKGETLEAMSPFRIAKATFRP